jgi:hypothetical protein
MFLFSVKFAKPAVSRVCALLVAKAAKCPCTTALDAGCKQEHSHCLRDFLGSRIVCDDLLLRMVLSGHTG